jgi:tripartite-type tricarboxylate transporter receptor subunit TctC
MIAEGQVGARGAEQAVHTWGPSLLAALLACSAVVLSPATSAQTGTEFPNRLVRIVCVNAPGGGLDIIGRLIADRLTKNLNQTVILENRSGAGGNIASEFVARAPADGYTLLETTNNHNINAFIYKAPGYNPRRDFVAVTQVTEAPSVVVAGAQTSYRSLKDLIAAARAQPGKITYASGGNGQPTHIAGEMFKKAASIDLVHVPYKGGGPATLDLVAGQVPVGMSALPSVTPHIQDGKLRALAVTSDKRWPTLPDTPSVAESGYPGYRHMTWIGILAPAGTPAAVIARLNKEIASVLANADLRQRIVTVGAEPVASSSAEFEAMLKAEYEATAKLVAEIGLKVD